MNEDAENKARSPESEQPSSKPNIVLITLDAGRRDLLFENLDLLPNLKRLAERSVVFDNAFSVGPVTTFAFPGIIAGLYPYHWGAGVSRGVKAVDEVVKDSGYRTAFIIEWNPLLTQHFGYGVTADFQQCRFALAEARQRAPAAGEGARGMPQARAWRFLDRPYPLVGVVWRLRPVWERHRLARAAGAYALSLYQFVRLYSRKTGPNIEKARREHTVFRETVLGFVKEGFQAPQFLWIHTTVNHLPYLAPAVSSSFSPRRANYLNARGVAKFVNRGVCQELKKLYVESLMVADSLVGDVLGALSSRGLLDTSIIIVTSDHGEEFMEEGTFFHEVESSSDILLHVPLMISYGGRFQPKRVPTPVSSIDIAPTLCDLLGVQRPDNFRGISLKPLLDQTLADSAGDEKLWNRPLFSEGWVLKSMLNRRPGYESHKRVFTVRKNRFKLKVTEVEGGGGRVEEDLELTDWVTGRRLDLKSHRDVVEDMLHLLRGHIYEEGCLVRNLSKKAEQQHLKAALSKVAKKRLASKAIPSGPGS